MTINFQKRSIFINGLIIASACFAIFYFSEILVPTDKNLWGDIVVDLFGILILLFGIYLRISARGHKHERLCENRTIVTDGPYSLTQNPMYLASFFIGFGMVMMILRWWVLFAYTAAYLLWYWPQIYNERKVLLRKYGQTFRDYSSKTPLFFPNPKTLIHIHSARLLPMKKVWIKREWNTILVWFLVAFVAEGCKSISVYPTTGIITEAAVLIAVSGLAILVLLFTARE